MITSTNIIPENLNTLMQDSLEKTNWYERIKQPLKLSEYKELFQEKADLLNKIAMKTFVYIQIALNDWDSVGESCNRINYQKKGQILWNEEYKAIRYKSNCDGVIQEYVHKDNRTEESKKHTTKYTTRIGATWAEEPPRIWGEENNKKRQYLTFHCFSEHLDQYMAEAQRMIEEFENAHNPFAF